MLNVKCASFFKLYRKEYKDKKYKKRKMFYLQANLLARGVYVVVNEEVNHILTVCKLLCFMLKTFIQISVITGYNCNVNNLFYIFFSFDHSAELNRTQSQ